MKSNTQAIHLEEMMQEKSASGKYKIFLPFCMIKKSHLKKLSKDMFFLLGTKKLELLIEQGANSYFDTIIEKRKIVIGNRHEDALYEYDSKKYKKLKIAFSAEVIVSLERGEKIDVGTLDFNHLSLYAGDLLVAEGSLVNINDTLAVRIDEVVS